MPESVAQDFSDEVWLLSRPINIQGDITATAYAIVNHPVDPKSVVGFTDDNYSLYIAQTATSVTYGNLIQSCVDAGYCTAGDKTTVLNYISANKGNVVLVQNLFPATMWAARLTDAQMDSAGYLAGVT